MGFRKKRKAINSSVTRTRLPGVNADGENELVQARTVPAVVAEKSRAAMMLGAREGETKHADQVYRDIGIPIFDVSAGRSQLHDIIQRGQGR
jgi:hypothetical protein